MKNTHTTIGETSREFLIFCHNLNPGDVLFYLWSVRSFYLSKTCTDIYLQNKAYIIKCYDTFNFYKFNQHFTSSVTKYYV